MYLEIVFLATSLTIAIVCILDPSFCSNTPNPSKCEENWKAFMLAETINLSDSYLK